MLSKTRIAMAAVMACVAFLFAAASASAVTVSPSGAYVAASGTTTLRLNSNGQTLTCTRSSISANIASNGTGAIPTGGAVYTSCTNPLLGTFTVRQIAPWALTVSIVSGNATLDVSVPRGAAQISGPGCTFTVGGTVRLTASGTVVTPTTPAPVTSSALTIDSNNGGALCGFFPVGLTASYGGTYNLNRTATVTP